MERTREQIAELKRFRALAAELVDEQLSRRDLPRGTTGPMTATAFIAEIQAEVEALLGQGTMDLEAWETAARRCVQVAARALEEKLNAAPATTGDPGCLANAAGRRAMRDAAASASPASWVRWCWSEPTTTASGVSRASNRELGLEGGSLSGAVRMVGT